MYVRPPQTSESLIDLEGSQMFKDFEVDSEGLRHCRVWEGLEGLGNTEEPAYNRLQGNKGFCQLDKKFITEEVE